MVIFFAIVFTPMWPLPPSLIQFIVDLYCAQALTSVYVSSLKGCAQNESVTKEEDIHDKSNIPPCTGRIWESM